MRKLLLEVVVFALVSASSPLLLHAQTDSACLEKIGAKLHRGEGLILIKSDVSKISGWFESIDVSRSMLLMSRKKNAFTYKLYSYHISAIREIKYGSSRKLRPTFLLMSIAVGAGIGAVIGGSSDNWSRATIRTGSLVGAGGGLVVGSVVSLAIPSMKSIRCSKK
ncbi:MAG: hypothetical protein Q8O10_09920 [candidate division Zixibacteria bacterium]|nr:hypothetical protein [candidate division Zixibacteria bacterium]